MPILTEMQQNDFFRHSLILELELEMLQEYIVNAFMLAFPEKLAEEEMVFKCSDGSKRYVWSIFEENLKSYFYSFHRVKRFATAYELYQHKPLPSNGWIKVQIVLRDLLLALKLCL